MNRFDTHFLIYPAINSAPKRATCFVGKYFLTKTIISPPRFPMVFEERVNANRRKNNDGNENWKNHKTGGGHIVNSIVKPLTV